MGKMSVVVPVQMEGDREFGREEPTIGIRCSSWQPFFFYFFFFNCSQSLEVNGGIEKGGDAEIFGGQVKRGFSFSIPD